MSDNSNAERQRAAKITEAQVKEAIIKLKQSTGMEPTVEAIRQLIGGSPNTILKFRTKINQDQAKRLSELQENDINPEDIESKAKEIVRLAFLGNMQRAKHKAEAASAMAENLIATHEREINELNEKITQLEEALTQERQKNQDIEGKLEKSTKQIEDLQRLNNSQKMELATERQRADSAEAAFNNIKSIENSLKSYMEQLKKQK